MPESHFVYTFNTTGSNVNMSCTTDNRVTGITRVLEDPQREPGAEPLVGDSGAKFAKLRQVYI